MPPEASEGGRVFFSAAKRMMTEEDELRLLSIGVDIGSATSHLVFSRIVLERFDSRYVVVSREVVYQSPILLTPYTADGLIDADKLGEFFADAYAFANLTPEQVDTGALVLTGVAVRRRNARNIGELFAGQAGKLVAVSAGDNLETVMAAHGSGAVSRSIREQNTVVNIDIGGGTSKIALCDKGEVVELTAVDIGARLVCLDKDGAIVRLEEAGKSLSTELGLDLKIGDTPSHEVLERLVDHMADRLMDALKGRPTAPGAIDLHRLAPLSGKVALDVISFSGGVSEYLYGHQQGSFGDLGPLLGAAIRRRIDALGLTPQPPTQTIRATVIGASQYTVQVSGSTIFVSPDDALPQRNIPVVAPDLPLSDNVLDPEAISAALKAGLERLDLTANEGPVAVFLRWRGSATFHRLDALCRGLRQGLVASLSKGFPVILVGDRDIGGLIGMHLREELNIDNPIVSIDGLDLKAFDFIDIGQVIEGSGATPVVIKSLIFPASENIGRDWSPHKTGRPEPVAG
jgi:ethanolamine utilization protein EutA